MPHVQRSWRAYVRCICHRFPITCCSVGYKCRRSSELGIARGSLQSKLTLFPSVYLFRPAYIYPVQPRKEPNFSYRLLRAIYLAFQLLFPNQVIRADDLARAMVNVAIRGTERGCLVFETV